MRSRYPFITLFLFFIAFGAYAVESTIDDKYLSSIVNEIKQMAGLPSGTAIAVVKDDKLVFEGYFGFKNIATKAPVDQETVFYIASTTKPMTALNFLLDKKQKPELGRVTMAQMFPEFQLSSRRDVTTHNLLTHTASINNLPLVLATAYSGEHSPQSLNDIVIHLSDESSEAVGEFKYTNVGYNIYSVYSDKINDLSWQEKLWNQVFKPAGMLATTAMRSKISNQNDIAKTYSLPRENNTEALYLDKIDATMHAAGGVYSNARDLSKFLIAQLNNGIVSGQQVYPADVIAESHVKQVQTNTSYGDFDRDGYAWGWYTGEYKKELMLHHFGGFAGIHSHLSFMPEKKIGLVVLNSEDFLSSKLTGLIADYIYGALLGEADIQSRVSARANELKNKLSSLNKMIAAETRKIASRDWLLTLPEQQYVGNYTHPLLGTIKVR